LNQLKKSRGHIGLIHIGNKEKSGLQILEKLKQHQFFVTEWDIEDNTYELEGIDDVDSIIVNIGITNYDYDELLDLLFEKNIKIIINEAELTNELSGVKRQSWERHLLNKIDPSFQVVPTKTQEQDKSDPVYLDEFGIQQVWILAASIGGPEAIQEFLSTFKGHEKVLFILVQHMDKEFLPKMADQLNNNSQLTVEIPVSGMKVKPSSCLICPTDEFLRINKNGILEFEIKHEEYAYSPSIDECSKRFTVNIENVNMAIFSGMSTDGIEAAKSVKQKHNKVITQDEETCVLSTIISGVKEIMNIDFDGKPTEMAHYIIRNSEI
jgi:chemosensory pili system protein ChpB (putative protein-glutamate methylesterase)